MQSPDQKQAQTFTGNIFIFHSYDVGDDINLEKIEKLRAITKVPLTLPKYFKNYHIPLAVELPHPHGTSHCISCKIHRFGALSLTYKIPFHGTFENLRADFNNIANTYQEQSAIDAKSVFKRIKSCIIQPNFFQTTACYIVIQVNPQPNFDLKQINEQHGGVIASMLRFETETLSEFQKNEILDSAIGYFRGNLIVIDIDTAFVYDDEYEDILDLFEFANIQQLELRFFDRLLDQQLNIIYEREARALPFRAYLPFLSTLAHDPIGILGKLRAEISVITERLESSVKLAGEPYFLEIYELLVEKLGLQNWRDAIDRKLRIVEDVQTVYQRKIDTNREDLISVLITILIFIELVIGILHYLK